MMKFGKVWGETSPLLSTPFVEVSVIRVRAGFRCSWHHHAFRANCFYVLKGAIDVEVRKKDYDLVDVTPLEAGDMTVVPPGEEHRFTCDVDAEVLEIYYPVPLLTGDIVRSDVGGAS